MEQTRHLDALTQLYLALSPEERVAFIDRVVEIDHAEAEIETVEKELDDAFANRGRSKRKFARLS